MFHGQFGERVLNTEGSLFAFFLGGACSLSLSPPCLSLPALQLSHSAVVSNGLRVTSVPHSRSLQDAGMIRTSPSGRGGPNARCSELQGKSASDPQV